MKFNRIPHIFLLTAVVAAVPILSCAGARADVSSGGPAPSETAPLFVEGLMGSLGDGFGLIQGGAEAMTAPLKGVGELFSAPRNSAPIKYRPNLNYNPYSSGLRLNSRTTIRPIAEYYRIWDNNLFRSQNGRKEDTYHRVITGFFSSHNIDDRGQNRIRFGYLATLEYFDRHSNQDHDDHMITGGGNFRVGDVRLSGDARWARMSSRGNINLPDPQSLREDAYVRGLAELPLGRAFSEFEVINYHTDSLVRANAKFDRNELSLMPRLGLNLNAVDQIYFEYGRTEIDYPNTDDRDGSADQYGVGVRKVVSPKTVANALLGYQSRVYEIDERPDYFGLAGLLRVQHLIEEGHGVTLQFERRPFETSFDNQSFAVQNTLTYDYRRPLWNKDLQLIKRGSVSYQTYSRNSTIAGDTETRREYVWNDAVGCEYFLPGGFSSFYFLYSYSAIESNTANLAIDNQQITYGFKGYF